MSAENDHHLIDSAHAWRRLAISLLISTIGGVGVWSVVVALPAVQAEFGVDRAGASLPYTMVMVGFGIGGIIMGRIADKVGIVPPVIASALALGLGYALAGYSQSLWQFALIHGLLIGLVGASSILAPMMADISFWFNRRRGIAVALIACGNYIAGAIWPPILNHFITTQGWRATHIAVGLICVVTMVPLALLLRRRLSVSAVQSAAPSAAARASTGLSPGTLQALLIVAGLSCCLAMAMPQVHIVAYCGDLGYGVARGAEMLSIMLGLGVVSRIASGFIADRIGGIPTLLIGSTLQALSLVLFLFFDSLVSLYLISALFGLVQGGIVPSYAIIIRELFPPRDAGTRIGLVVAATVFGMAIGGWMSGKIFDMTGSYDMAFLNGVIWNLLNMTIAAFLLLRARTGGQRDGRPALAA
jgi:MFS family permease